MPRRTPLQKIDTAIQRRARAQEQLEQANRELANRAKDALWDHTGDAVAKRVGVSRQWLYKFMETYASPEPEEADRPAD